MPDPVALVAMTVNCPTRNVAESIAEHLVAQRLVAAANILSPTSSLYVWEGEQNTREEIPILLKTRAALFDTVAQHIRNLHPYVTPSIGGQVIDHVDDDYRRWVCEATRDGQV